MCTSIAVGKSATRDHQIIIARNEDCARPNWNKALIRRNQPEYVINPNSVSGGLWTLGNGLKVPVPDERFTYIGAPDAAACREATAVVGDRFFFEERGVNDQNFAISATNSMTTNDAAAAADPFVGNGIAESILPTLLLPQARSAAHALDLLAHYLATYGASEPNGLLLADPEESWYVEIGSAHHWIAVRIPPQCYLVVANGMRVHGVDLNDKVSVRHSPGLLEFVTEHRLLPEPGPANFNFAQAFGILGVSYNVDREWLAQSILSPSVKQQPRQQQYPLFLKPDLPLGIEEVMAVLRATYAGTKLDGIATRPIGYEKTAESHVIALDAKMPAALRGIIWQCVSTPLCAPYLPFYAAMVHVPASYASGGDIYGNNSAYWAYRGLHVLAKTASADAEDEVAHMWRTYECGFVQEQPYLRRALKDMDTASPSAAITFAGRYSSGVAYEAVARAQGTRNALMTELTTAADEKPSAASAQLAKAV